MKKKEIGEFLYRFYRKRTSSFLAHVYKASITGDSRDIHRARLDVKRIFALYGLFEMLDPAIFKHRGGYKLFRPLYRQAGKIREIQVNYILLANPLPHTFECSSFTLWLKEEEHNAASKFLLMVKKFKEAELTDTDKMIEKICHCSSIFKLRSKTMAYIIDKAEQVKDLQLNQPDEDDIHKIRKTLKAMATISTLVYSVKSGKWLDQVITSLNKTEMMIGDWHDRVVLKKSIERFLAENRNVPEPELHSLNLLKQTLTDYNLNLVQHFMPEVKAVVETVLTI
ncbi:MAG: CHAD domain-containing protein [Bacteroidetes bacterium]|nr:CHAD domain-containing protein [Bacteroidota bacterium]